MSELSIEELRLAIADGDSSPLLDAVHRNDIERLNMLISFGADVNIFDDEYRMTPLHYAASSGKRGCLKALINSGRCDYTLLDRFGRSAATVAIEWGEDFAAGRLLARKKLIQEVQRRGSLLA
ncbi:ankyrin repeat domain-containing protein [Variovorax sp. H27-G14]|uniref:ankyrin repeat domain-containing protein n=1 Tax=Variovorax sp. H27-G14 TaxID=3111914 RepID=UPI0038FCB626